MPADAAAMEEALLLVRAARSAASGKGNEGLSIFPLGSNEDVNSGYRFFFFLWEELTQRHTSQGNKDAGHSILGNLGSKELLAIIRQGLEASKHLAHRLIQQLMLSRLRVILLKAVEPSLDLGDEICDEGLFLVLVSSDDGDILANIGMLRERYVDLTQLNSETPDLYSYKKSISCPLSRFCIAIDAIPPRKLLQSRSIVGSG